MFTKEQWNKELTHILGSQKSSKRDDLQIEILPPWETALKWGLGGHSGEIAFTCAPAADSVLTSGGQSEVQAVIQQFPYILLIWIKTWNTEENCGPVRSRKTADDREGQVDSVVWIVSIYFHN